MRKPLLLILFTILIMSIACNPIQKADPGKTYLTDVPYNPQMYTSFLNKEINPVTNILVTQMGLADKVVDGEYPAQDVLDTLNENLKTVQECIDAVDTMLPPADYMENREAVLRIMSNVKDTLETFRDELNEGSFDPDVIKSLRNVMEGDFLSLTSQYNTYWE